MAHYEMLVIGTGPAGQKAAVQAAKLGKKVGIIERKEVVGGVCINTGTIPSKSLREAVLYLSGFRQRTLYGAGYRLKEDDHDGRPGLPRQPRHHERNPHRPEPDGPQQGRSDVWDGAASSIRIDCVIQQGDEDD